MAVVVPAGARDVQEAFRPSAAGRHPRGASVVFRSDPRVAQGLPHSSSRRMRISDLSDELSGIPYAKKIAGQLGVLVGLLRLPPRALDQPGDHEPDRVHLLDVRLRTRSPAAPARAGQLLGWPTSSPTPARIAGTARESSCRFTSGRRFAMPTGRAARGRYRRPGPAPRSPRPSDHCQPRGRSANRA